MVKYRVVKKGIAFSILTPIRKILNTKITYIEFSIIINIDNFGPTILKIKYN